MTPHDHATFTPGCYRCELGRDEAMSALVDERDELEAEVERLRAKNDRLCGLLTLWANFAPAYVRAIAPGPNRKTLVELTRAAFDEAQS